MQHLQSSARPVLGTIDSALTELHRQLTSLRSDVEQAHALLAHGDSDLALAALDRARDGVRALGIIAPAAPVAVAA